MRTIKCATCGIEIVTDAPRKKFCDACSAERIRLRDVERMQKKRLKNPGYQTEINKRFYAKHREREIKRAVDYGKANPEKRNANHKRWRENNPEKWKEHCAKNFQRHKARITDASKKWNKDHPEAARKSRITRWNRRRALLMGAEGEWTPRQFAELCDASDNRCWYCHKQFDKLTVEHIQPLSRGGSNDISNIAPVCPSCNYTKRDKTVLEFMTRKTF